MTLLEDRRADVVDTDTEECRIEHCDEPGYVRQAFKAPSGELCSVLVCRHHYGMKDILP